MEQALAYLAKNLPQMTDQIGVQRVYNDLCAKEAGFECSEEQMAHIQGPHSYGKVNADDVVINVDLNDERVVFRFNSVYDVDADERMDVVFFMSADGSVSL